MRNRIFGLLLAIGTTAAQSPQPPAKLSFEVATVKLHPGIIQFSSDPSIRGSRVTSTASTLLDLLTYAYAVRYDQISGGSAWIRSEHYDFNAKAEGENPLTDEQARQML